MHWVSPSSNAPVSRAKRSWVLALLTGTALYACGDGPQGLESPIVSVSVTPANVSFTALGDTEKLTATARDANDNVVADVSFTWSSSDENCAAVNSAGLVTSTGNGTATVSATIAGVSGRTSVTVAQVVAAVGVKPSPTTLTSIGQTVQLTASASDPGGNLVSNATFTWSSSDPGVASVTSSGLVESVANGTATISATAQGVSGSAEIRVEQPAQRLAFLEQPATHLLGDSISPAIRVAILDPLGAPIASAAEDVTLTTTPDATNGSPASLLGTTTVSLVDGVAVFEELWVDRIGTQYKLVASSGTIAPDTSDPFDVGIDLVSVSSGWGLACGIMAGGRTACGGGIPTLVPGAVRFVSLDVGAGYACGVTAAGTGHCFGSNRYGQLGDGTNNDATVPTGVAGGLAFQVIVAGGRHTCGLTTAGAAYCWGAPTLLGDGTVFASSTPVLVSGGLTFSTLDIAVTGENELAHTCALDTSGAAYCWGLNHYGQLGDSTTDYQLAPVPVIGGFTFEQISAGEVFTCALNQDGKAYCWGANLDGLLGIGSAEGPITRTPTPVTGDLTFASITAGAVHMCGLTQEGTAYCWGWNQYGALGDGTTTHRNAPTLVSGDLTFASLSAGSYFTCGVSADETVYCWGSGYGAKTLVPTPTPVQGQW